MTLEEQCVNEMRDFLGSAIHYLEQATNVVESNDSLNDGQSEKVNFIYDKVIEAIKLIEGV